MNNITLETTESIMKKWTPLAAGVPETSPGMPVTVLAGEALDLSHFIQGQWEPVTGDKARPGLKAALVGGLIEENIAQELSELIVAVSHTHAQFRAITAETLQAPVERGEFLLSEIRQCLEFLFDDGVNDVQDAELARLSESHTDTSSHDALALSLEGFAYYANRFRDRLAELPEFDPAMIDEALVVANRLREQSALKLSSEQQDRQKRALSLRNRLVTLLTERMSKVRRAARFVFRNHPDVARLANSGYWRRNRARRRVREDVSTESQEVAAS